MKRGEEKRDKKQYRENEANEQANPKDKAVAAAKRKKHAEELKEEMDKLVDEIDEVLEQNAAQFVKDYVQRGGE